MQAMMVISDERFAAGTPQKGQSVLTRRREMILPVRSLADGLDATLSRRQAEQTAVAQSR